MDYSNFAAYYDALTQNVEYDKRAARLHYLIRQYIRTETDGTLLTDLACGSGSLSEFCGLNHLVNLVALSGTLCGEA